MTRPKGGGAIRGIGEKFNVSPATGTGSMMVPLVSAPGRAGFAPELSLSYDSGAGNGPFGFGWSLGVASISRKTDKGLPRYDDAGESDVFVLAGGEELVPVLDAGGERVRVRRRLAEVDYEVASYRPRIEGNFARIERWTQIEDGTTHWRTISGDNVTTLFGLDEDSRVADPADPRRAFTYLISRSFDAKGNAIVYDYVPEDERGVDLAQAHEANRPAAARTTQRYLKSIRYGNAEPFRPSWAETGKPTALPKQWLFQVVFDFGDHAAEAPGPEPDRAWPVRPDPHSSHRASFEVRSYRRVERALLFHHFPAEEGIGTDCLVRSTNLTYSDEEAPVDPRNPVYTFLRSVTQNGYRRKGGGYLARSLPPLEFSYSEPQIQTEVLTLDPDSAANLPRGIEGDGFRSVDLDGDGLSGVLLENEGEWAYKPNLSPLAEAGARFGPLQAVDPLPSSTDPRARTQLLDLAGDGALDAVSLTPDSAGFFERTPARGWEPFQPLEQVPAIDWNDPNLRFVDLTGDGLADVLVAGEGCFRFHRSLGEAGFGEAEQVPHPLDEDQGPRLVFADGTATIFLADMCGDGLVDLVRVRSGEVCYWPNLGYGRFGGKVTMDASPLLGTPEGFDPKRVHLADIDGSGTADLVFDGADGVVVCFNRCGNSWGEPQTVTAFPQERGSLEVTDLLGNGTACLVWSSPLPADAAAPLRYVDLMGGRKPHLMIGCRNNLGAETRLSYAPSTRFMLEDERAGRPWATRLPFPVQVVERVETLDWIGRSRFVNRYAYHHGHFDGAEREFRGFGMVERWDTEEHRGDTVFGGEQAANWDASSWSPPVLERSWFHTGAYLEGEELARRYAAEYWVEPQLRPPQRAAEREAMLLADTQLDPATPPAEEAEACRALKGMMLRKEIYALDGGEREEHPYTVTEQSFEVRRLQGRGPNRHAVFQAHPRETLSFDYERRPDDPRVRHEVTLDVDKFGNPLARASVCYPRRPGFDPPAPHLTADFQAMLAHDQSRLHLSLTESEYTEALTDPGKFPDAHRLPLTAGTTVSELTGFEPQAAIADLTNLFTWRELREAWEAVRGGAHDVPYEEIPAGDVDGSAAAAPAPARRIVERSRVRYRRDDLSGLLGFGALEPLALAGVTYRLALTPQLVTRLLGNRVDEATLTAAGYVKLAGSEAWWTPSDRVFYSAGDADTPAQERAEALDHFFMPRRAVDAFGAISRVAYDDYALLLAATSDEVGNEVQVENDYRVLAPRLITDPNGNRTETAFDALGLVCGTAERGKKGQKLGDSLAGFEPDLDEETLLAHLADPFADPAAILGEASGRMLYDVFAYQRSREDPEPQPPAFYGLSRETHAADDPEAKTRYEHTFAYSDGFGREIQRKLEVEAGPVPGAGTPAHRWVGSGWTIFDNKGQPVRNYEPFFSATPGFEFARAVGVSTVLLYDPMGRVVATLHPDQTWEKVVFDNWRQESWDPGDTVLGRDEKGKVRASDPRLDPDVGDRFRRLLGADPKAFESWHQRRIGGSFGSSAAQRLAEKDAAEKSEAYFGTPSIAHLDAVGRTCLRISDDGNGNLLPSRVALDAEDKPLAVFDAQGRRVIEFVAREPRKGGGFTYLAGYAISGFGLYRNGMDGGERRAFADVAGNPILSWDEIGRGFRTRFDAAGRPTHRYVLEPGAEAETLLERLLYGEGMPERNLCGRVFRQYDEAGLSTSERHDFKGNLTEASRQLTSDHHPGVDWSALEDLTDPGELDEAAAPLLSAADRFVSTTSYDAHNRVVQVVTPHGGGIRPNVLRPSYGRGGLPDGLDVWIRRATAPTALLDRASADLHAVSGAEHNARGQRTRLVLGNGTETTYAYDELSFQLARLATTRGAAFPAAERVVQDLSYSYDAAGNITRIRDDADIQNVVFFRNKRVDPTMDFSYDALYRLSAARGREHLGQNGGALAAPLQPGADDGPRTGLLHPGDGNAMDTYTETYTYDLAGNLEEVVHQVSSGAWRRRHVYGEPSLIDAAENSNRLSAVSLPGDPAKGPFSGNCEYDGHGNALRMPGIASLGWDARDRLRACSRQVVAEGTPETTYYSYDGSGQRLRKATDRQAAAEATPSRRSERIYLGPLELYREYGADGMTVTLARETLHVELEGLRVAMVETRTAGADPGPEQLVRYQYSNHFGSAALELDPKAAVISYEEYFPYGSTSYQAVRSATETPKRYRWSGKERDEESGLYYHGARYYAPWLGRWASPDPIGLGDGANLYAYSQGNPIRMHDPGGTQGEDDFSSVNHTVDDLNKSELKFDPLDRSKNDPSIKSGPEATGGKSMSKKEAKNRHKKQTTDYRKANKMAGSEVQAGHTAAKRHVGDSGISAQDWDKQPMQQLHSRKGKGLDVEVTDQSGKKATTTRHRSQEQLIDQGVDRMKKPGSPTGGKLTPQGQLDNAAQVEWQTQGTGMDQREVDKIRNSGPAKPEKGPPVDSKGKVVVKEEAKVAKAEAQAVASEAKAVKAEAKALKAEAKALAEVGKGAKVAGKLAKAGRHFAAAIPLLGIAAGQASAAYSASQGDYTGAALDEAGFIPVVGDLLDAGRGGVAIGEALDEGLGISDVAGEHGMKVEGAAKKLGFSEDNSRLIGAFGAAASSITVAPTIALKRTISGWLK